MVDQVDHASGSKQAIGIISDGGWASYGVVEIRHPSSNLPVGSLQAFLDAFMKDGGAEKIDYVHGEEVVCQLGAQPGNAGFYVPGMHKSDLFKTVILDGALPRKTFSMVRPRRSAFIWKRER